MDDIDRSLPAALAAAAARHPDRQIGIYDRRGRRANVRTHAEVLAGARRVAERMAGAGVTAGDRVVVCLPTSWEWFDAWLGALLLGAVPVATPAAAATRAVTSERVEEAVALVDARLVVGRRLADDSAGPSSRLGRALLLTPEELASAPAKSFPDPDPEPESLAFLQFTSGSTGQPRAVMIPHRAALHQAYAQDEVVGAPWDVQSRELFDALISWLPLYHDMGLLGIFYSMLNGRDLWQLPPQAFLARPRSWLEAAGTRGTTVTAAPNFSYQLCAERLGSGDSEGLDLTEFKAALTGAEMVRAATIDAFCERFASSGFERKRFRPCYGLAESTLAVTLDRSGEGPRTLPVPAGADAGLGLDRLVGNGTPVPGTDLRITAPDGASLGAGELGEVRVQGPSVFLGYYDDPEATAETLQGGWLRTGDLGFLDRGELFIAGRLKEILIVRGQNMMPHEFERLAEAATGGGGASRAAAFSVASGPEGEQLVVVVESGSAQAADLSEAADRVRRRIGRELGLPVADVVMVRRGRIPRTTSGKVQRDQVRRSYLAGELQRLG